MTKFRKFCMVAASPLWLLAVPIIVLAAQVTLPFTFVAGTTADATQVNANFTALRDGINNLHTNGGVVLAAAHVTGGVGPTITRSFTNLPGAPAISVVRQSLGVYLVSFGANVSARFYNVIHGNAATGTPTAGFADVTPAAGDPNALFIQIFNAAGALTDTNFFVEVF